MVGGGDRQVQLGEDVGDVLLHRALETTRLAAMAEFVRPSAMSSSTWRSRALSPDRASVRRDAPISWVTTSGSRAVPPDATRTSASTKSATSATRSLSR